MIRVPIRQLFGLNEAHTSAPKAGGYVIKGPAVSITERSDCRFVSLAKVAVLTIIAIGAAIAPTDAGAQGPSEAELIEMVPGADAFHYPGDISPYRGPYARWRGGTAVSILVVTDEQASSCAESAISDIRTNWALIRREIPAFSNSPDIAISGQLPAGGESYDITISLPTERRRVADALSKLATRREGLGQYVEIDRSKGWSHGLRNSFDTPKQRSVYEFTDVTVVQIKEDLIQFAYNWATNDRGISFWDGKDCNEHLWSRPLYLSLGAYNLSLAPTNSLLEPYAINRLRTFFELSGAYTRVFLRALYSMPAKFEVVQLRERYRQLLNLAIPDIQRTNVPR